MDSAIELQSGVRPTRPDYADPTKLDCSLAAAIVVDQSGSMGGRRETAAVAMLTLADALDGEVARMAVPEVGLMAVTLTPAGRADPLFDGLDERLACLQWHDCEFRAPPGGEIGDSRGPYHE